MLRVFISSVQKELAAERRAVKEFIRHDPLLSRFIGDVFLFEDIPACDRKPDDIYLGEVEERDIYLAILGNQYGAEDADAISPTEREFDRATAKGKPRLVFVKGKDNKARHPKMAALVKKAGAQLIRRRFASVPDLTAAVNASLVDYLDRRGVIQDRPFEERPCAAASLADIDQNVVSTFTRRARSQRRFPLAEDASVHDILVHLHLLVGDQVTNAALLLFGRDPQQFIPCAEIRCMHFHGTEIQRPVPFYRIFKGNLFEQVDHAVDFVLSKVNRSVGTRAQGPEAPVRLELPEDVVAEAIVNAVVHRDYASSAAVQVSVFADRVEVWNPGELQPPLTPESLKKPHRSILRNPHIAEAMFLAHYIEKYGTGTLMMIRESIKHALPEPRFDIQQPGEFGTTIWRDWLTDEVMDELGVTERQRIAVEHLKSQGQMSNQTYRQLVGVSKPTASRDLEQLHDLHIVERVGHTGKGTHYVLKGKGLIKGSMGSRNIMGSQRAHPQSAMIAHEVVAANKPTRMPAIATKGTEDRREKRAKESSLISSLKRSGKTADEILNIFAQNPQITIPEVAGHLELTTRGVKKHIATLKKQSRLRRIGPDKGGHWEVLA